MSKCGHCGSFSFQLEEVSPSQSKFKFYFVQCSSCHVPVGVVDFNHTGSLIEGLSKKINSVSEDLRTLDHNVRVIANKLRN